MADVYPQRIPDLFGAKPVVLTGRYSSAGRATIRLKGKVAGNDFIREIPVELPETMASHDVLASLWARARIDSLMAQNYAGAQAGTMPAELKDTIMQLGIEYRLMTQFTSFVAVEEMIVTDGGQPRRVDVPVEVAEGVNQIDREEPGREQFIAQFWIGRRQGSKPKTQARTGGGIGYGVGGAGGGGRAPANAPPAVSVTTTMSGANKAPMPSAAGDGNFKLTKDEQRRDEVGQKLHVSVFNLVDRLRKHQIIPTADEVKFVRDGKAEVQIWLTEKSEAVLAQMKELGFEVVLDPKSSKLVIGRVEIEKLEAIARLKFVRYVSPQMIK